MIIKQTCFGVEKKFWAPTNLFLYFDLKHIYWSPSNKTNFFLWKTTESAKKQRLFDSGQKQIRCRWHFRFFGGVRSEGPSSSLLPGEVNLFYLCVFWTKIDTCNKLVYLLDELGEKRGKQNLREQTNLFWPRQNFIMLSETFFYLTPCISKKSGSSHGDV